MTAAPYTPTSEKVNKPWREVFAVYAEPATLTATPAAPATPAPTATPDPSANPASTAAPARPTAAN